MDQGNLEQRTHTCFLGNLSRRIIISNILGLRVECGIRRGEWGMGNEEGGGARESPPVEDDATEIKGF